MANIGLDVQGVVAELQDAVYALQSGNSKSAEASARRAVEAMASHHFGKKVVVVCQPGRSQGARG